MSFAQISTDLTYMVIDNDAFLARFPDLERPSIQHGKTKNVALTGQGNFLAGDFNGASHPQEQQALLCQAYGHQGASCHRCFHGHSGTPESGSSKVPKTVFAECRTKKGVALGACGECLWRHKPHECSLSELSNTPAQLAQTPPPRTPTTPGKRSGTRAANAASGEKLADPMVYLPVRALSTLTPSRRRNTESSGGTSSGFINEPDNDLYGVSDKEDGASPASAEDVTISPPATQVAASVIPTSVVSAGASDIEPDEPLEWVPPVETEAEDWYYQRLPGRPIASSQLAHDQAVARNKQVIARNERRREERLRKAQFEG
ncbi:hypothetical protein OEA41_008407 [Lepraria neglecta]|uniref:Uncharacterized protein n=1 Tax=Lepraria neglecta TaxID=209136 RepID=A0AAD9ZHD1_9LECA|nr:hypothetical protein OEA41_008407 [Lepraria neglecta]